MIGSAKITYDNEDVCNLVRKDLVDKFGNRELANYNLYTPGVIKPKAVVEKFPDPVVKVTTVEEQMEAMGIYPKQQVPRNPNSVTVDPECGPISTVFDVKQRKLIVSGGPVKWTSVAGNQAHWYKVLIDFPMGFTFEEGYFIPFTMNGVPSLLEVDAADVEAGHIEVYCDAKYTTMNLQFNWNDDYGPEMIKILCNASLESQAIDKIPEFPTEPKFEFIYPTGVTVDSNVEVDVDLDLGKY